MARSPAVGFATKRLSFERRVRGQRSLHALEEYVIVRRASRAAADDGGPLHHVGITGRPVIGLHAAHRPAVNQRDLLDSKLLDQQTALHRDRVVIADVRERRFSGIGRRRRQAIAEQIRDDDEIAIGVQDTAGLDQPFRIVMLRAEGRRIDDYVILGRIQGAVGLVGEPQRREYDARLQPDVACLKDMVVGQRSSYRQSLGRDRAQTLTVLMVHYLDSTCNPPR